MMGSFFNINLKSRHRQIFGLIKGHRGRFFLSMFCSLLISATTAASAWLLEPAINLIFIEKNMLMVNLFPLVIIGLYMIRGVGIYGQEYLMSFVGQDIIRKLRNRLYNRIQDLPISFFQQEKTGVLMSRITNDVNIIRAMVSDTVKAALRDCFSIFLLIGVIFYRDWQLAIIAVVIMPVAFMPVVKFGRRVRKFSTRSQEAMADMSAFLHETFAGNKIVKAFGMEPYEKERFADKAMALFHLEIKNVRSKALSPAVMEMFAGLGIAFILWYGGTKVVAGTSTPGTLISFIAAVAFLYDPIKKLSRANNIIQEGLAATDRVYDVIETETTIREAENAVHIQKAPHRVVFDHVHFRYDTVDVLHDISLSVTSGEVLALVGMSGGGKSTLVNLIPRFFDVSQGRILIDDRDVRSISLTSLREQIAIVSQEPILFNDTVRNNIAYGRPGATDADIAAAARAAYAYDFVQRFPKKFETTIGELGSRLSGGEKQRLCIARAILKDAPILILDEATSSLDTEAEMWVQKALENLMKGRTTFVIAHRLSTIAHADRIVVLVGGRITETGTHAALLAANGDYRKLHDMQFVNNAETAQKESAGYS